MNPTVEAAWIAAGVAGLGIAGTETVAIAGFRSTKNATIRTIAASTANTMASLAAAREDRLWENGRLPPRKPSRRCSTGR